MPHRVAVACLEAIPRLQAREALLMASVVAVGAGKLKKDAAGQTMRAWRRAAGYEAKARKPGNRDELIAALRASGIGVEVVKKKAVPDV